MLRAAVLTVSDRAARGEREDATGPRLADCLRGHGFEVDVSVVADEQVEIATRLRELALDHALVLTTGGTGLGPRDVTPEATREVIEREAPGFPEEMRRQSAAKFPRAILSRAVAGTLGSCLILNLPGSPNGALECFEFVSGPLLHGMRVLGGGLRDCRDDPA